MPDCRFYPVEPQYPLVFCSACSCVIVDDDEGSNRAAHQRLHDQIETARLRL